MSFPSGSTPVNVDYIRALRSRLDTALDCQHLEQIALEAVPSLQASATAIATQVAQITALEALLTPPTTPAALITWVGEFITLFVGPQVKPLIAYAVQAPELIAEIALLTAEITAARGRFPDCTFTVPGL